MSDAESSAADAERRGRANERLLLALICAMLAVLGVFWTRGTSTAHSLGWDEAQHAGAPAVAMALELRAGRPVAAAQVAVECQQYPFAYPAYLGAVQAVLGVSERSARRASRALWPLGLLGFVLCGRELARALARRRATSGAEPAAAPVGGLSHVLWIGAFLAALSPLALAFSGTLFLELPFVTVSAFALHAWLRRDGELAGWRGARRELWAGALIALAFFTKFNYGLLLGLGLSLDLVCSGLGSLRERRLGRFLGRTGLLALPSAIAFLWWFVYPWPGDGVLGASHREAFLAFLDGNRDQPFRPLSLRVWDVGTYLFDGPLLAAAVLLGALLALPRIAVPQVRAVWLVLLATTVPVWTHPFHLERFLLPSLLPLCLAAGVGFGALFDALFDALGRRPMGDLGGALRRFAATGLVPLGLGAGLVFSGALARPFATALGVRTEASEQGAGNADYIDALHRERLSLKPSRALPTAGLERAASDGLLDAISAELAPGERVGWLGITSELSPAALHLGLLERADDPESGARRFLGEARAQRPDGQPAMVLTFLSEDPGWTPEQLARWAAEFDVLLTSDPVDWKGRRGREFIAGYRDALVGSGAWEVRELAVVPVARPTREPTPVRLFAARPR